jgi:hypothetical protein
MLKRSKKMHFADLADNKPKNVKGAVKCMSHRGITGCDA